MKYSPREHVKMALRPLSLEQLQRAAGYRRKFLLNGRIYKDGHG